LDRASDDDNWTIDLFGSTFPLPQERKFGSIESIELFLKRVAMLSSIQDEYPGVKGPKVDPSKKSANGAYPSWSQYNPGSETIFIPPHGGGISNQMRELVALHEMAHHVTKVGSHSPKFLKGYHLLIGEVMDPTFAALHKMCVLDAGGKV